METSIAQLSKIARQAIARRDGRTLQEAFQKILHLDSSNSEGYFLKGTFFKVQGKLTESKGAFEQALDIDLGRYDAAVELAELLLASQENARIVKLLKRSEGAMQNSPYYLNLSGEIYSRIGLHDAAWPLFNAANNIQKNAGPIEANLAGSAAKVGEMETAKFFYKKRLVETPEHQRNHFELSRLSQAKDDQHIKQMKSLLRNNGKDGPGNIFFYFALAKEYEDLGNWNDAFKYLKLGNKFAAQQARKSGYNVQMDLELIEAIIDTHNKVWIDDRSDTPLTSSSPIFITGLPRTGTTLVERIVSAHSKVESVGESFFLDTAIQRAGGAQNYRNITADIVKRAAQKSASDILSDYMAAIEYRRTQTPFFIEKLPLNFLNIGFILKAMPNANLVILDRKPMDACFAMYKQPYFRFSYDLSWLAAYYVAFDRLRKHWAAIAGERIITVNYEELVHDPEPQIKGLISKLGFEFEPACLDFHLSKTASATASFAQIRRKTHTDSVNKWLKFKTYLQPFAIELEAAGIDTRPYEAPT